MAVFGALLSFSEEGVKTPSAKMDLHTALETFAEVWVAANTQTAVNSEPGVSFATC